MKDHLIPQADPKLRFNKLSSELNSCFNKVLKYGNYILGDELNSFEYNFSNYINSEFCIGVNSCTDALELSLKAIGIGHGDEVITTNITAPATIISILNSGATPVIVDVEPPTYCISPKAILNNISKKTKAVIPVHLHGFAASMKEIQQIAQSHNLQIIEDCAQATGATINNKKTGSFGDCSVFSFYPTKNLGTLGDGGAIVTNNTKWNEKIRGLRNYGFVEEGYVKHKGINSRLDEIQAAFLNILLQHIDDYNQQRVHYAKLYNEALIEYREQLPPIIDGSIYHQYSIRVKNRDKFRTDLFDLGIITNVHYDYTMKDHPLLKPYCRKTPISEKVVKEFVSLPIQPEILDIHFEEIIDKVKLCLKNQ